MLVHHFGMVHWNHLLVGSPTGVSSITSSGDRKHCAWFFVALRSANTK